MEYDVRCDDCGGDGFDRKDNNYKCSTCSGTGFEQIELFSSEEMIVALEAVKSAIDLAKQYRVLIDELETENLLQTQLLNVERKRLYWIARQDLSELSFQLVKDSPHDGEYFVSGDKFHGYGATLGEAIDAAMNIESKTVLNHIYGKL